MTGHGVVSIVAEDTTANKKEKVMRMIALMMAAAAMLAGCAPRFERISVLNAPAYWYAKDARTDQIEIHFQGQMYAGVPEGLPSELPIRVLSSIGGSVALAKSGWGDTRQVYIDGLCMSACAWMFVLHENVCFTPNAEFAFHGVHDRILFANDSGQQLEMFALNLVDTLKLYETLPGELRAAISDILTSTNNVPVSLALIERLYPSRKCAGEWPDV